MEKRPDFSTLPSHIWSDHIIPQIPLADLFNLATTSPLLHEYFLRSTKLSRKTFNSWLQPVLMNQTQFSYVYLPIYGLLLPDRRNKPLPRNVVKHMLSRLTTLQIDILHNLTVTKLRQESKSINEYRVRILQIIHPKLKTTAEKRGFEYIKCDSAVFGMLDLKEGCHIHRIVVLGLDSYCFDNSDKKCEAVYSKYVDYQKISYKRTLFGIELDYNGVDSTCVHTRASYKSLLDSPSGRTIRNITFSNADFDGSIRDRSLNKKINRSRIMNFTLQKMNRNNRIESIGSYNLAQYLFQANDESTVGMFKRIFPNAMNIGMINPKFYLFGRYLKENTTTGKIL